MQLGRLVVAWSLVVVWFGLATFLVASLVGRMGSLPGEGFWVAVDPKVLKRRVVEATLLTLVGSLWFDSLGSGEWWVVFLLVGALATVSSWFRWPDGVPKKVVITEGLAEIARYVVAGALLAWRLS